MGGSSTGVGGESGGAVATGGSAGLADAGTGAGGTAGAESGAGDGGDAAAACSPGGAVAFPVSGADVYLPGVDATRSSGFTWEFWFNASQLPSTSSVDIRAGATMLISADQPHGCEDIYLGLGTEFTPANALAFNVDGSGLCSARDTSAINYVPPAGFETQHWYFVAASHDYAGQVTDLY